MTVEKSINLLTRLEHIRDLAAAAAVCLDGAGTTTAKRVGGTQKGGKGAIVACVVSCRCCLGNGFLSCEYMYTTRRIIGSIKFEGFSWSTLVPGPLFLSLR